MKETISNYTSLEIHSPDLISATAMWSLNPVLLYLLFEVFLLVNSCIFFPKQLCLRFPTANFEAKVLLEYQHGEPLPAADCVGDSVVSCIHQPSRWTCGMVAGPEDWSSPLPLPCGDIQVGDATGQLRCKENH